MSPQSRLVAGIVLIIVPTVEIGGASILSLLIADPAYAQNDLRQDLWRAGHAHAGVWLVLSLVALRYVDEATLSEGMRWVVRVAFPVAALLMALGFFLSVLSPEATEPNALINLTFVAGLLLAVGLLVLGVGLIPGAWNGERVEGSFSDVPLTHIFGCSAQPRPMRQNSYVEYRRCVARTRVRVQDVLENQA